MLKMRDKIQSENTKLLSVTFSLSFLAFLPERSFKVDRERYARKQRSWTRFEPRMLWFYCVYLRSLHHSVGKIFIRKQSCFYQPEPL